MQARLTVFRIPSLLIAIVFALVAATILGGVLGYTLKPQVVTQGKTQVVVVPNSDGATYDSPCTWVDHVKNC
jgi:FlaG/FlaF family flagellin (archaellin)